ncbi:hypothetical protein CIG75_17250 [Tumebacillus algifaecis]|uniref:Uncharacterized protein n=1 Tax=Tumebacillus algifaecis TaxID=1214604 RepID=A0A223D520_9BACL|nr:hypothetical protein [Tumebacillus algifaecis]ASS76533.1 hypothetical protein CIG75_17250 [Tumebacillus algifaecis]
MNTFLSSFAVEIKLLRRNYWTWLFFFLLVTYVGYTFSFFMGEKDPGGTLVASAFIVQVGIFVSLLLGLSLVRREYFSSSEEIFLSLANGFRSKILGKLAALWSILTLFLASTLLVLYGFYFRADVAAVFYQKALLYLLLYWGVPFFLSGIIGMIVGAYMKSKAAYPLLLLLWTFLGPLNVSIYQLPMAVTGVNATQFLQFINLGQTSFTDPYDPVYGLPMESFRWNQKSFLLLIVVGVIWMITLFKNYRRTIPVKQLLFFPLLVVGLVLLSFNFSSYQQKSQVNDYAYYEHNRAVQIESTTAYQITSYEIALKTDNGLQAQVMLQVLPLENIDRLVFTLYHDLRVTKVADEMGQPLQFQQRGDQTEIIFLSKVKQGQQVLLNVKYEGHSSPYFFANEQAVMLPNYFPWLPTEGSHQAMHVGSIDLRRTPLAPQHDIAYSLQYQGNVQLYTNLPQTANNQWKGTVPNGLTIVGGMMTETKIGQTRVIYPVSLTSMLKDVPAYLSRTQQALGLINGDWRFSTPTSLPETVFFLSTPTETNNYTGDMWLGQDHVLVNINQSYNLGLLQHETSQIEKLLFAFIRSPESVKQPLDMHVLLVNSYDYWVHFRQGDVSSVSVRRLQRSYQMSGMKREAETLQQIMTYVEQNSNDSHRMQTFFHEWLKLLQQSESMGWKDISSLQAASKGGQ